MGSGNLDEGNTLSMVTAVGLPILCTRHAMPCLLNKIYALSHRMPPSCLVLAVAPQVLMLHSFMSHLHTSLNL